ncbi:MAG TPA: cysteine desulfurase family protein [Candidatus Tectomicrobia bacterium]|nr:cysteine desulfurase family protein [Candidatus Tectomicrobia bacterium]
MGETSIYLDHNATTPLHPAVWEAMRPFLTEAFGNPSSLHTEGLQAREAVEEARHHVARLIGARAEEIVFTSGGTEADNLAILGGMLAQRRERGHIITSQIEHPAVLGSCLALEAQGFRVTRVAVAPDGTIDPDDIAHAFTDNTRLVTLMHANNELGTIQPIQACAAMARARGILMHTDAVQSVGKIPTLVDDLGVDLLSLSGHKFHGPKGIGALYVRRGVALDPIITGGPQEGGLRGGTEHVAAIVGLGAAAQFAGACMSDEMRQVAALRDRLEQGILASIPDVVVNGAMAPRLPTTANLSFKGVDGQSLVVALDLKGIATSTGSACSSGSLEPSHVLIAMGLADGWLQGAIRFSLGSGNTLGEVDTVLHILPPIVARLRQHTGGSVRQATRTPVPLHHHS